MLLWGQRVSWGLSVIRFIINVAVISLLLWVWLFRTPITTLCVGDQRLQLETAFKPYTRKKGLQGVESLTDREGMLFLYDDPRQPSFWMYKVLIPLDIAWLANNGRIVAVDSMELCDTHKDDCPSYQSPEPISAVVEVRSGWFEDHGVAVGDRFHECEVD